MNYKSFKTLALVGSAVLGLSLAAGTAQADPDADMTAHIGTSGVITAATGNVMDFGIWLIGIPAAQPASTLVMNPATGVVVPTAGGTTQLIELSGSAAVRQVGTVSVYVPTGGDGVTLQLSHGAIGGTLGAGLALSDISYYNPDNVDHPTETGVMVQGNLYPLTIDVGGAGGAVAVQFGGTITATTTPSDGNHGDTFNIAFAY